MSADDPLDNNGLYEVRITPKLFGDENGKKKMSGDKVNNSFSAGVNQKWLVLCP